MVDKIMERHTKRAFYKGQ